MIETLLAIEPFLQATIFVLFVLSAVGATYSTRRWLQIRTKRIRSLPRE